MAGGAAAGAAAAWAIWRFKKLRDPGGVSHLALVCPLFVFCVPFLVRVWHPFGIGCHPNVFFMVANGIKKHFVDSEKQFG